LTYPLPFKTEKEKEGVMRDRCRGPHVTHYSLSTLINGIKKHLSHYFGNMLQWLFGWGEGDMPAQTAIKRSFSDQKVRPR